MMRDPNVGRCHVMIGKSNTFTAVHFAELLDLVVPRTSFHSWRDSMSLLEALPLGSAISAL